MFRVPHAGHAARIPAEDGTRNTNKLQPMTRRCDRVNELLKREISAVLQRDFEFPGRLVTVNEVEVTQDFKDAKVWVGVLGEGDAGEVLDRLNGQHGFIQNKVMRRVVLKSTPVLDFRLDDSVARGVDIVRLLEEIEKLPTAPPADPGEPQ